MDAVSTHFPRVLRAGESCLIIEFGNAVDLSLNARVQALRTKIEAAPFPGFLDTVPTYRSLAVCFNPLKTPNQAPEALEKYLLSLAEGLEGETRREDWVVHLPVCYEGSELAPDLGRVAEHTGLSADEVVRRHSANDCYCYMLGFTPGFPYLGGMDGSLETPRLKEPREKIPAGSVGIAVKQTGVYSIESPGGWNLIGRTPLKLFDPNRTVPIFLSAGMWVRFVPIGLDEFTRVAAESALPDWQPEITRREVSSS